MGSFKNRYHLYGASALQCILFGCAVTFYAVVRPYKMNLCNNVDSLTLVLLVGLSVELCIAANFIAVQVFAYYALVTILLLLVPHMVLIFYICYLLAKKTGLTQCLKKKFKTLKSCMQGTGHTRQVEADESITSFLPDRLINPGEYEPVLSTTEEHDAVTSQSMKILKD